MATSKSYYAIKTIISAKTNISFFTYGKTLKVLSCVHGYGGRGVWFRRTTFLKYSFFQNKLPRRSFKMTRLTTCLD